MISLWVLTFWQVKPSATIKDCTFLLVASSGLKCFVSFYSSWITIYCKPCFTIYSDTESLVVIVYLRQEFSTTLVDDLFYLYANPKHTSNRVEKNKVSRQQLSAYRSNSPSPPLCIKRHAWQTIDPQMGT